MGTPGYMSPEQVRGERFDHRSDLFSFGLVLFEMLGGARCFRRNTAAETMTAILREDPPELTELNPNVSPPLERIVRRCLDKQPPRRFQSAHDLAFALENRAGATTASALAARPTTDSTGPSEWPAGRVLPWALTALAMVAVFGMAWRMAVERRASAQADAATARAPQLIELHLPEPVEGGDRILLFYSHERP